MTDNPSFYTDHRAIDLAAGDLAERLERGAGPITIIHDAGVPRYAIFRSSSGKCWGRYRCSRR